MSDSRSIFWIIGIIGGMLIFLAFAGGCTTRGDTGRLLGVRFDLSVGENSSFATTAGDETEAGENITGFRPTPEATTETPRRGFEGLEVNRD